MGMRPIVIREREKTAKIAMAPTLSKIKFEKETDKEFLFRHDQVSVSGMMFKWAQNSHVLIQDSEAKYSFETIKGVKCIKREFSNGDTTSEGTNHSLQISQKRKGAIIITKVFSLGKLSSLPQRISQIGKDGRELPVKEFWYDEFGNVLKYVTHFPTKAEFSRIGNVEMAREPETNKVLWKKTFNASGLPVWIEYGDDYGGSKYAFDYGTSKDLVRVIKQKNGKAEETLLPRKQLYAMLKFSPPTTTTQRKEYNE
jgi:hypothetical protein